MSTIIPCLTAFLREKISLILLYASLMWPKAKKRVQGQAGVYVQFPRILGPKKTLCSQNPPEADICVEIAKLLSGKEFKIITPYNGQTTLIDKKLQASRDLPKEDRQGKCNNVDSFQGENGMGILSYSSCD
jgi:AAA domain